MDNFCNSHIHVRQIQMAALIRKTIPQEKRSVVHRSPYGLILKLSGRTLYRFSDNNLELMLEPGYVMFLPQGCSYTAITEEPGECIAVNFDGTVQLPKGCHRSTPFLHTSASAKIENLFRHLYDCLGARLQPDPRSEYTALSLLYEIFATICTPTRPSQAGLEDAEKRMHERMDDPSLTMTELAQTAGLSASYFRKRFTETYGVAPVRYLMLLRVAHARRLLTETKLPISDIAKASGFADVYYFSRIFSQNTGLSPSAYRKQYETSF